MNGVKQKSLIISLVFVLSLCVVTICVKASDKTVKLNKTKVTLAVGESTKLVLKNKKSVSWNSSNPSVAIVKKGKIVAKKIGKTVVKAKCGSKSYKCNVIVTMSPKDQVKKMEYKNDIFNETTVGSILAIYQNGDPLGKKVEDSNVVKAMLSKLTRLSLSEVEINSSKEDVKTGYTSNYYFTLLFKNGSFKTLYMGDDYISYNNKQYKTEIELVTGFRDLMKKYGETLD